MDIAVKEAMDTANPRESALPPDSTGLLLATAAELVEHASAAGLASLRLTLDGVTLLSLLAVRPCADAARLAELAALSVPAVRHTLNDLRFQGFVEQIGDSPAITRSGREALEGWRRLEASLMPARCGAGLPRLRTELESVIAALGGQNGQSHESA